MKRLILYTTLGCHLCEQAESMMLPLLHERGYQLEKIEISDSEELVERYGIRIPVIQISNGLEQFNQEVGPWDELGWPFDLEQLTYYLSVKR